MIDAKNPVRPSPTLWREGLFKRLTNGFGENLVSRIPFISHHKSFEAGRQSFVRVLQGH